MKWRTITIVIMLFSMSSCYTSKLKPGIYVQKNTLENGINAILISDTIKLYYQGIGLDIGCSPIAINDSTIEFEFHGLENTRKVTRGVKLKPNKIIVLYDVHTKSTYKLDKKFQWPENCRAL